MTRNWSLRHETNFLKQVDSSSVQLLHNIAFPKWTVYLHSLATLSRLLLSTPTNYSQIFFCNKFLDDKTTNQTGV